MIIMMTIIIIGRHLENKVYAKLLHHSDWAVHNENNNNHDDSIAEAIKYIYTEEVMHTAHHSGYSGHLVRMSEMQRDMERW